MDISKRYDLEKQEEWRKWADDVPGFQFPSHWNVQIIPPFGGAIVRFIVAANGRKVSVYLDCYDRLGFFGAPYWEIYPYQGDTYRCEMDKKDDLLARIEESLSATELND